MSWRLSSVSMVMQDVHKLNVAWKCHYKLCHIIQNTSHDMKMSAIECIGSVIQFCGAHNEYAFALMRSQSDERENNALRRHILYVPLD